MSNGHFEGSKVKGTISIGHFTEYRGIVGTISVTDDTYHGKLLGINGFVDYTADNVLNIAHRILVTSVVS